MGYLETYITKSLSNAGNGSYSGVSQTYLSMGREYDVYTIGLCDDSYIQIMVESRTIKKQLETLTTKNDIKTYFEGELIEAPFCINHKWFENVNPKDYPHIDTIIEKYVIQEVNIDDQMNVLYAGISLIFCSIILYVAIGGIKDYVVEEVLSKPHRSTSYHLNYNLQNDLLAEKERLKRFEKRQAALRRDSFFQLIPLILGLLIIIIPYWLEFKLLGILLVLYALQGLFVCFINSDHILAVPLAKFFKIKSIYLKKMECENKILELQELLDDNYP
ncbi:MAG: hypothetical protein IJF07_09745 [Lachnospiraceae bacterium]|nr:hypothetical protein [Lachnospiraceae bacterium]